MQRASAARQSRSRSCRPSRRAVGYGVCRPRQALHTRCYCANPISPALRYGDNKPESQVPLGCGNVSFSSVLNASRLIPQLLVCPPTTRSSGIKPETYRKAGDRPGTPTGSRDLLFCPPQSAMGGPCQYQLSRDSRQMCGGWLWLEAERVSTTPCLDVSTPLSQTVEATCVRCMYSAHTRGRDQEGHHLLVPGNHLGFGSDIRVFSNRRVVCFSCRISPASGASHPLRIASTVCTEYNGRCLLSEELYIPIRVRVVQVRNYRAYRVQLSSGDA